MPLSVSNPSLTNQARVLSPSKIAWNFEASYLQRTVIAAGVPATGAAETGGSDAVETGAAVASENGAGAAAVAELSTMCSSRGCWRNTAD